MSLLNILNSLLAFDDGSPTDNPALRDFDWTRKLSQIQVSNPSRTKIVVPPLGSAQLFDGTVDTDLDGTSDVSLALLDAQQSLYRLTVTAGPSGFRTARAVSGITSCAVTTNNSSVAVFTFAGATLTSVQEGDVMRIAGAVLNDPGAFEFNPLNAGLWTVLAVSGTAVSVARPAGTQFVAATETVAAAASDVQFYSADGVQVGQKLSVTGTLSIVSRQTYAVAAVTPSTIDFVSGTPLPQQSGLDYSPGTFTFYSNSKRLMYIEVTQESILRMNGDSGSSCLLGPVVAGDPTLPGCFQKWGDTYQATIVNRSVNPLIVTLLTAE